jgi:hypothetical protein
VTAAATTAVAVAMSVIVAMVMTVLVVAAAAATTTLAAAATTFKILGLGHAAQFDGLGNEVLDAVAQAVQLFLGFNEIFGHRVGDQGVATLLEIGSSSLSGRAWCCFSCNARPLCMTASYWARASSSPMKASMF